LTELIRDLAAFQVAEEYKADVVWTHPCGAPIRNATHRPPTGLAILDTPSAPKLADALLIARGRPRF